MTTVTIEQMKAITLEAYKHNPKQNLGFKGLPGAGKTEGILQAVEELKKINPNFFCKVYILSQMGPEDFMIPWPQEGQYNFLVHKDFIFDPNAKGIILFDEAANAQGDTLKAVQNMLSGRHLHDQKIPDGVMFVILSNRKEDRAGANTFNTAFANRIEWHNIDIDFPSWEKWAIDHGIDVSITSYLKKFKNKLIDFKPEREVNATPRSWAKVNDVINSKFRFERISGLVGEGQAGEFITYLNVFMEFPEIEDIIQNPDKCKLPKSNDAQYALSNALAAWTTAENWVPFTVYANRLSKEYLSMFMLEATKRHPLLALKKTPEYTNFIYKNQKDLI